MPRAKTKSPATYKNGANMPEMINCHLSDEQKAAVKANIPPVKTLLEAIEEWCADHYKLTISFDDSTDCYSVFLIGKEDQATNAGLMLSAYAPVLNGALAMLLFKHQHVLQGDWGVHSAGNNGNNWR